MARLHRITHPIIGPATWKEMQAAAEVIRATGRRICTWCHGDLRHRRARTRCGSVECDEMIWRAYSWQRCVRVAMKAAGSKCSKCGPGKWAAEVDHIVPVSLGGLGDQSNLRPLCMDCHKEATRRLRGEKESYVAA